MNDEENNEYDDARTGNTRRRAELREKGGFAGKIMYRKRNYTKYADTSTRKYSLFLYIILSAEPPFSP